MSYPPSSQQTRRLLPALARAAMLLALLLTASAWLSIMAAGEAQDRILRQRFCLLCHTDGFRQPLPCLQQWQKGTPLREPLQQRLQEAHPLLAGGDALAPLTDTLFARQLAALSATRPQEQGKSLYLAKCAVCHGRDGLGQPGLYPPLRGSEWLTASPSRLPEILSQGLQGPITVKGEPWDGVMLAPGLPEEQQHPLIHYLQESMR